MLERRKAGSLALALLPMAMAVAWRFSLPDDLDSNDQAKQALYVLDIFERGNWILPREQGVLPATKPPLYAWLAALASAPAGGPTETACRVPSMLASLALAWLIWHLGSRRWSNAAGVAAAWIFATTHTVLKLCIHVRPDMVLTVLTTTALLALLWREGERPRANAPLFWLATSLSILAKGPPGPVLIGGGLLLLSFSREERGRVKRLLTSPWMALLGLPLLWFVLALREGGEAYLTGTVLGELSKRAPGTFGSDDNLPGTLFVHFVVRAAPWSLLALIASARLASRKTAPEVRRDLLPFAAWFIPALAFFSVLRGQREDYLLPLLPPAALLVARALSDPTAALERRVWDAVAVLFAPAALLLGALAFLAVWPSARNGPPVARYLWGGSLIAAALLTAWGWRRDRSGGASRLTAGFFLRTLALLVVSLTFHATPSPQARSGKGRDLEEFVSRVGRERREGDEISFFGDVTNGVRFSTRVNAPSLPPEGVAALDPGPPSGGRRLLITDAPGEEALNAFKPGRFQVYFHHPHGKENPDLVLGEWLPGPGG